uniref:Uncharacterized protein n=1 Tax=Rhizophagus irregularis (strain DAOM 181602 / DAOM 197198 / MUCL 43194) TaxID=747089 RepID=U9SL03_RHIID
MACSKLFSGDLPDFIQHLSSFKICCSIEKWITTVGTSTTSNEQHSRYFTRKTNLQIPISTKLIYKLLFLIFIENGANLHSFEVTFIRKIEIDYFNEIFELILQNPNFIYNIKNFKIDFHEITDNIMEFLRNIYSNCKSISSLDFQFPSFVLNEAFNQLNALESIHIVYCYSLDSNFVQQIMKEENEDIFPYIKEYIMKTKRVEYLAILENIDGKYEDLFFQKEKVKVFQLHGIKVLNYSDLVINVYDFIKEIC